MSIKANLIVEQGAEFTASINVTDDDGNPVNLTEYTGASHVRKNYSSSSYWYFNVSINEVAGIVTLTMNSDSTATMAFGRYVYDCNLTDPDGNVSRLMEGIVTVTPGVTR